MFIILTVCVETFCCAWSHPDTPHSVGLPWTSDQLVAETSTWQHKTITRYSHAPGGIRTRNPDKRVTADPRLRPRGQEKSSLLRIQYVIRCHTQVSDSDFFYSRCDVRPSVLPPGWLSWQVTHSFQCSYHLFFTTLYSGYTNNDFELSGC